MGYKLFIELVSSLVELPEVMDWISCPLNRVLSTSLIVIRCYFELRWKCNLRTDVLVGVA